MNYSIEQFYRFFQGVLVFQFFYMVILSGLTKRKDALIYSLYLFLLAVYFFWNAPYTFFNINDDIVFDSRIYIYLNTPLVIITNLAYVWFLKTFFSSIYQNRQLDKMVLFITIISPCLIIASSVSIYLLRSNQYIFYAVNLISTLFSIYLLIDIRRRKINNVKWIVFGIVFNIIGNWGTVVMIILGQYGINTLFTIGYPLLFMRCGILLDMAFYQIAIIKKWSAQEKELAVQHLKTQIEVEKVKNQISKELHDDIGSTLSGINMYSHMAKEQTAAGNTEASGKTLEVIQKASDEMIYKLKDMVWAMQPGNETIGQLVDKIKEYAIFITGAKNIKLQTSFVKDVEELNLSAETMHHIYTIAKEALNNAVKYSGATLISIDTECKNELFTLRISDNGSGFVREQVPEGNGLLNMEKRAQEIGAKLELLTSPGGGTEWQLWAKIT